MLMCPNCRKQLSAGATTCLHCGAQTTVPPSPAAAAPTQADDVFKTAALPSDPTLLSGSIRVSAEPTLLSGSRNAPTENEPPALRHSEFGTTDTGVSAGRVLGQRYRLDALIASGGMGEVYRARRLHIGDTVAVKVLRREMVDNPVTRERFHREARAAAKLRHPNAVVIHDFGEDPDGVVYIVMELLEGRSLREVLRADGPLAEVRAAEIVRQVCAVLEEGHRQGVVHRDIKPDNIMLVPTRDGSELAKLLDFGIAKLRDGTPGAAVPDPDLALTKLGSFIGTPIYMSPEQCQGEAADERSDIYSLGVVLYELLGGAPPFTGKSTTGIAIKHVTEPPPPLNALRPDINPAVERVVLSALAKEPDARPQTPLDFARAFAAALDEEPTPEPDTQSIDKRSVRPDATTLVDDAPATGFFDPGTEVLPKASSSLPAEVAAPLNYDTVIAEPLSPPSPSPIPPSAPMPPKFSVAALTPQQRKMLLGAAALMLVLAAARLFWPAAADEEQPDTSPPLAMAVATAQPSLSPSPSPSPVNEENMVLIDGGALLMGRDDGETNERPLHSVQVEPFYLDKTEVTNEQYEAFVAAKNYPAPPSWPDGKMPADAEKLPVTEVSWEDARNFAQWATKRLPTEKEWEFAVRGVTEELYPWGAEWRADAANAANEQKRLLPVGSFPAGASLPGVLDLIGNAWEWTESDYKAYPGGPALALPRGQTNLKVMRGGSFESSIKQANGVTRGGLPATPRNWGKPEQVSYKGIGFRCARDVQ